MKITISPHSDKKDILTLFLDEDFYKNIHVSVFGKRPTFPSVATLEEWQDIFNQYEYRCTKNYVLRRLAMQSYYSIQLEKLLKERLVQPLTSKRIIDECISWGYIDDQAWLDSFIRAYTSRYSKRAISLKLQAKGVPLTIIQELLEKEYLPTQEPQIIKKLLQTKYRHKNFDDYKEKRKVMSALIRKGYSFEAIRCTFNQMGVKEDCELS